MTSYHAPFRDGLSSSKKDTPTNYKKFTSSTANKTFENTSTVCCDKYRDTVEVASATVANKRTASCAEDIGSSTSSSKWSRFLPDLMQDNPDDDD